jgi:hypothetical protein
VGLGWGGGLGRGGDELEVEVGRGEGGREGQIEGERLMGAQGAREGVQMGANLQAKG